MSGFGPPPGASSDPALVQRPRPPSYLPPGGLASRGPTRASRPVMMSTHKPGIIGLRPLSVSDLLDAATKFVRGSAGPTLLTALIVVAIGVVPSALVAGLVSSGSWYSTLDLGAVLSPGEATGFLLTVGVAWAAIVLSGVLSISVSEAVLGRRVGLGTVWALLRPRAWRLVALALFVLGTAVVPPAFLVLVLVAVSSQPTAVVITVGVATVLVGAGWIVAVAWRTVAAAPALVLERLGLRAAVRRGWRLGHRGLRRVTGALLMVGLISGVVFAVLDLVVYLVLELAVELAGLPSEVSDTALLLAANLATLVAATLVAPFVASAATLLYVDRRMRLEGFDLVLQRASSAGAAGVVDGVRSPG